MKPILFNTEMVLAILDGRKTQTRRVVKFPDGMTGRLPRDGSRNILFYPGGIKHPPYMPGDILYVRETWGFFPCSDCEQPDDCKEQTGHKPDTLKVDGKQVDGCFVYRANYGTTEDDSFPPSVFKWRPSIHMPKAATRIFLRVTSVRAEKLRDITEAEATKEGLYKGWRRSGRGSLALSARQAFMWLWETITCDGPAAETWACNPWVWVIEFERCEKPESEKQ